MRERKKMLKKGKLDENWSCLELAWSSPFDQEMKLGDKKNSR